MARAGDRSRCAAGRPAAIASLVVLGLACTTTLSKQTTLAEAAKQRTWEGDVYYALPRAMIDVWLPVVEVTMRPGPFCKDARRFEGVSHPPASEPDFCDLSPDAAWIRYHLTEAALRSRTLPDPSAVYRIDRLPLTLRASLEPRLAAHGFLTGDALTPLPEATPAPVSAGGEVRRACCAGEIGFVRPADPSDAALLIHRLQESRLGMVSGYRTGLSLPDRDTLELMLTETDRAIGELDSLFVDVQRSPRWVHRTWVPQPSDFGATPSSVTCGLAGSADEASIVLGRFDERHGLRQVSLDRDATSSATDDDASRSEDAVCLVVKLVDGPLAQQVEGGPKSLRGIAYREGRLAQMSIRFRDDELARGTVLLEHLGPVQTIAPAALGEGPMAR